MQAKLIQRNIKLLEQILTGLYEEYNNLRKARKACNEESDKIAKQILDGAACTDDELKAFCDEENALRDHAAKYTPYIRKFKKKIAAVEELQRLLKSELKDAQSREAWMADESYEWDFSKFAGKQLYTVQGYVDSNGNVVWEQGAWDA